MHQQRCPKIIYILTTAGQKPNLQIMENEACDILKKTILKKNIPYQIVPLNINIRNAYERAIQTFKDYFIAGFCSTGPKYPAQEWDRILL